MATTQEFKKLDGNGFSVFVSNISGRKTRVSIVKGEDARNYKDGELVFQEVYSSWNRVPDSDIDRAYEITGQLNPAEATTL